jgi:hypothetical protein
MMRTRLDRSFREEHGVVAPLVALLLVAFIGMAALTIDVGRLYAQRADLQHSMDAAAIAGTAAFARELVPESGELETAKSKAKTAAETVANANGDSGATANILPGATVRDARIHVSSSRPTDLYFARVLKLFSVDVGAQSTARAWRAAGVHSKGNLIPLGLDESEWAKAKVGDELILKVLKDANQWGNFGCLRFPKTEPGWGYEEYLKNGYPERMYKDQWVGTEPGGNIGPTEKGLRERIGDTVLVPIVNFDGVHGYEDIQIIGFASVTIEHVDKEGKGNNEKIHVTATFVGLTSEGTDESVATGGIWSYKLVKN